MRKDNRGFGLIQVIIIMGIGAIIVVGITQTLTLSFKQSARLDRRMEIMQLSEILQMAFSSGNVCSDNFSGKAVNMGNPIQLQVTELKFNATSPPIVKVGAPYGDNGLEVQSIQVSDLAPLGSSTTEFAGTVNIDFESISGTMAPASFATIFDINSGNTIAACSKKITIPAEGSSSSSGSSGGDPKCNTGDPGTFGNVYAGHIDEDHITLYQCVNGKRKTILNWND